MDERIIRNPSTLPAPTPPGPRRLLCIGMATFDDYDGVYFSVQAIRLYHPEVTDKTEILVVDNHPRGPCAGPLKELERQVSGYRYVPYERTQGTAVRDVVFREANADFVLCMDSHVLFRPGALARLIEYLEAHPDSCDLLQGPLYADDLTLYATHFDPVWRSAMYGVWARDPRVLEPGAGPFEIPMQGLGVFACRRAAWPGFNPRLQGFGGEEGYVHEKVRRAGGRVLCLPFLGWVHRFGRPFGTPYPLAFDDRVRNYLLVHDELGLDPGPAIEHFEREFGAERVRPLVDRVERELRGPFHFFDAIYGITRDRDGERWQSIMRQGRALGIDHRIRCFPAIDTPDYPAIGNVLSHRAVLAEARWLGLGSVLVLEDDIVFSRHAADVLSKTLTALSGAEWTLLDLGGRRTPSAGLGRRSQQPVAGAISVHAVAYHCGAYERILQDVPATPTAVARWLGSHRDLGAYYAACLSATSVVTDQPVAIRADRVRDETPAFEALPEAG